MRRGTGQEPDTGERFAEVPGRWMCATPTRAQLPRPVSVSPPSYTQFTLHLEKRFLRLLFRNAATTRRSG